MGEIVQLADRDVERAKAKFIAAYSRGMRETAAEALYLSGMGMTGAEIGALVGNSKAWANRMIAWARGGFNGHPFADANDPNKGKDRAGYAGRHLPLKDKDNFEDDPTHNDEEAELVESPEVVKRNVFDTIDRHAAVVRAYKKIFRLSSFDRGAKKEISDAIERLISKWRAVQSTLTRRSPNGQPDQE